MKNLAEKAISAYCKAQINFQHWAEKHNELNTEKQQTLISLKSDESGMSTAEYAIGTLAAAAIAGALLAVAKSATFRQMLTKLLTQAFNV
ncbi:DUF4244 domain-containing protein [Actinomycetaceae bacterium TAE3-ERU4]|nr:DUF4244 domain-containing protein [Actinomycetaceae bacterium TAE3-ERU4]